MDTTFESVLQEMWGGARDKARGSELKRPVYISLSVLLYILHTKYIHTLKPDVGTCFG